MKLSEKQIEFSKKALGVLILLQVIPLFCMYVFGKSPDSQLHYYVRGWDINFLIMGTIILWKVLMWCFPGDTVGDTKQYKTNKLLRKVLGFAIISQVIALWVMCLFCNDNTDYLHYYLRGWQVNLTIVGTVVLGKVLMWCFSIPKKQEC